MNLGKAIRLLRVAHDMTLSDLSAAADISLSHLSLVERDKRQPSIGTVGKIAKAFHLSTSDLVDLAEQVERLRPSKQVQAAIEAGED